LSAVDKNSGRIAIHIHREKQYARQNVCIALFYRFFNVTQEIQSPSSPAALPGYQTKRLHQYNHFKFQ